MRRPAHREAAGLAERDGAWVTGPTLQLAGRPVSLLALGGRFEFYPGLAPAPGPGDTNGEVWVWPDTRCLHPGEAIEAAADLLRQWQRCGRRPSGASPARGKPPGRAADVTVAAGPAQAGTRRAGGRPLA